MRLLGKFLLRFLIYSIRASFDNGMFEIIWKDKIVFKGKADKFSIERDMIRGDNGRITIEFKDISN